MSSPRAALQHRQRFFRSEDQPQLRYGLFFLGALSLLAALALPPQAAAQDRAELEKHAANVRALLQKSKAFLQGNGYEWTETTVVTHGGETKDRKQARAYYGTDGKVQKIPLSDTPTQQSGPPGILPLGKLIKKAAEHQKEEMQQYMQRAAHLVQSYVPPDSERIQRVIAGGKGTLQILEPGRRIRLELRDYLQLGDVVGIELDPSSNRLLGIQVSSYIDTPQDPVSLDVRMGILPEGPSYASAVTLKAQAKDVTVSVENAQYRRRLQ